MKHSNDEYCVYGGNRCGECSLVNYGMDCHNNKVHLCGCGHRATAAQWFVDIFGEPNYTNIGKEDCHDCFLLKPSILPPSIVCGKTCPDYTDYPTGIPCDCLQI